MVNYIVFVGPQILCIRRWVSDWIIFNSKTSVSSRKVQYDLIIKKFIETNCFRCIIFAVRAVQFQKFKFIVNSFLIMNICLTVHNPSAMKSLFKSWMCSWQSTHEIKTWQSLDWPVGAVWSGDSESSPSASVWQRGRSRFGQRMVYQWRVPELSGSVFIRCASYYAQMVIQIHWKCLLMLPTVPLRLLGWSAA